MYEVWDIPSVTMIFEGSQQELIDFLNEFLEDGECALLEDLWIIVQDTKQVYKEPVLWVQLMNEVKKM